VICSNHSSSEQVDDFLFLFSFFPWPGPFFLLEESFSGNEKNHGACLFSQRFFLSFILQKSELISEPSNDKSSSKDKSVGKKKRGFFGVVKSIGKKVAGKRGKSKKSKSLAKGRAKNTPSSPSSPTSTSAANDYAQTPETQSYSPDFSRTSKFDTPSILEGSYEDEDNDNDSHVSDMGSNIDSEYFAAADEYGEEDDAFSAAVSVGKSVATAENISGGSSPPNSPLRYGPFAAKVPDFQQDIFNSDYRGPTTDLDLNLESAFECHPRRSKDEYKGPVDLDVTLSPDNSFVALPDLLPTLNRSEDIDDDDKNTEKLLADLGTALQLNQADDVARETVPVVLAVISDESTPTDADLSKTETKETIDPFSRAPIPEAEGVSTTSLMPHIMSVSTPVPDATPENPGNTPENSFSKKWRGSEASAPSSPEPEAKLNETPTTKLSALVCTALAPYKPLATRESPIKILTEASPTSSACTPDDSFSEWPEQEASSPSFDELEAKRDETNGTFVTAPFPEPEVVAQSLDKTAKGSASVCTAWIPYKPSTTPENPCKVLSEASPTTPARTLDDSFSKWPEPEASSPSSDELGAKVDETNDPFITAPFPEPEVVAQSLTKAAKGSASVCTALTPYKPGATPENPCKVLSEASPKTPARTLDASFSKWPEPEASSPIF
jgi:hypothetical protein